MYVYISLHYDLHFIVLMWLSCLSNRVLTKKNKFLASEENMRQRSLSDVLGSESRSSKDSNRLGYYAVSNDKKIT